MQKLPDAWQLFTWNVLILLRKNLTWLSACYPNRPFVYDRLTHRSATDRVDQTYLCENLQTLSKKNWGAGLLKLSFDDFENFTLAHACLQGRFTVWTSHTFSKAFRWCFGWEEVAWLLVKLSAPMQLLQQHLPQIHQQQHQQQQQQQLFWKVKRCKVKCKSHSLFSKSEVKSKTISNIL